MATAVAQKKQLQNFNLKTASKADIKARKKFLYNEFQLCQKDPISVIRQRANVIKLPNDLKKACIDDIEKWYLCSGPVYTVDKMKWIKQCFINYFTMGELPPTEGGQKVWCRKNKQGLLYGHWGSLMKIMKTQPHEVALFIQCYSVFQRKHNATVTPDMIAAYTGDLEKSFRGNEDSLGQVNQQLEQVTYKIIKGHVPKYILRDVQEPKHIMIDVRTNSDLQKQNLFTRVTDLMSSEYGINMFNQYEWVPRALGLEDYKISPIVLNNIQLLKDMGCKVTPYVAGHINWIHEPALKERVVNDFDKPLEHLTFPMGKNLYNIIKHVPWDTTYHEDRGYNQLMEHISNAKGKCYCYDLSKATDRFPLSTQASVLKSLCKNRPVFSDMVNIYLDACKLPAMLPNGDLTHWEVGQPMGSYPSFALFSLTHGMILMNRLYQTGREYNHQFIVHGDDMVILDEDLANYYEEFTAIAGVDVNKFKTIISHDYAEYNSRLITGDCIIRFPKWKQITPDAIFDAVQVWGLECIKWTGLGKTKQQKVRTLLSIPCILPNNNSYNPNGISIDERLSHASDDLLSELLIGSSSRKVCYISNRSLVISRLHNDWYASNPHFSLANFVNEPPEKYGIKEFHKEFRLNQMTPLEYAVLYDIFDEDDHRLKQLPKYVKKKPKYRVNYQLEPAIAEMYLCMVLSGLKYADEADRQLHTRVVRYLQPYFGVNTKILQTLSIDDCLSIMSDVVVHQQQLGIETNINVGGLKATNVKSEYHEKRKSQNVSRLHKLIKGIN